RARQGDLDPSGAQVPLRRRARDRARGIPDLAGGLDAALPLARIPLGALALAPDEFAPRDRSLAVVQRLDRLGKTLAMATHAPADRIAMGAAAEAVKEALVVAHGEAGRALVVEGAERHVFGSAAREPDLAADQLRERRALAGGGDCLGIEPELAQRERSH